MFHSTDFHNDYCKLMPKGITRAEKRRVYWRLVEIIVEHTLFRFGSGVILSDFSKLEANYPDVRKNVLGKPGSMMTVLCVRMYQWATANGYPKSISLIFDRGDEFWGERNRVTITFLGTPPNKRNGG